MIHRGWSSGPDPPKKVKGAKGREAPGRHQDTGIIYIYIDGIGSSNGKSRMRTSFREGCSVDQAEDMSLANLALQKETKGIPL